MSLFDDASLAMIPSAYKDGKLYSIKPTDGSGDFTFSRGSNLAATRVDVNGLIEKGRENLLLQSNQFDTTWITYRTTASDNQSGYDGSSDAWLLTCTNADGNAYQDISVNGVLTFSYYVKAGSVNWTRLRIDSTTTPDLNVWIDLTDGSVGTDNGIATYVESVGGGWYRVVGQTNTTGTQRVHIYPSDSDTNNSSSGSIYIQDAQLEQGLVATDYIETTTTTAQAGILEDMPRLDYSGGASCPSLLLEPQRTNAITQSEYFGSSDWTTLSDGETIVNNSVISPDGKLNASTLEGDGSSSSIYIRQDVTLTTSVDYTFSIFAKKGTNDFLAVSAEGFSGATNTLVIFDLNNSVVTTGVGNIDDYGNGWLRCIYTISISTDGVGRFLVYPAYNGTTRAFPTSGDANGQNIYIYGAMLEAGSYSSSYIPTYGTSQTRSQDICEQLNMSSLFGNEGSTIYFETIYYPETNNGQGERWVYAQGNSSSDYIRLWQDLTGGTKRIRALVRTNNVQQVNITSTATALGLSDTEPSVMKFAFAFAENDFRMYVNGNVRTETSGVIPPLVEMSFNNTFQTLFPLKQSLVFPTALTDSECIALTTL